MTHTDLIIIGGGPGGYEIAAEAARAGRKVILFEKGELGGTCLNRGCIPTKCLLASASTALAVKDAAKMGVEVAGFTLHYDVATARMRQVMDQLRSGIDMLLKDVTVIKAEASLAAHRVWPSDATDQHVPVPEACNIHDGPDGEVTKLPSVTADGKEYVADQIIIATGSQPATLPIEGAQLAITSDEFLALDKLPESVAIIGGGVIGMEFASILASFGVPVTVVEFCKEILPPFDKEVAKRLRTTLGRRGVKCVVGAGVTRLEQEGANTAVYYNGKKGEEKLTVETVIMAVGRRPVVPEGCAEAGVNLTAKGFIEVDPLMRTSAPGVFAVGDVNGRCMLAHAAAAQARVAMGEEVDIDYIPSAVFTIPECAMVGLTEEQCEKEGIEYRVAKSMFAANGKALAMGEGEGFVKVLYSPATRLIQGVHIIGPHAADIIAEATACMAEGATVDDVATAIVHGHPTLSEAFAAACAAAHP